MGRAEEPHIANVNLDEVRPGHPEYKARLVRTVLEELGISALKGIRNLAISAVILTALGNLGTTYVTPAELEKHDPSTGEKKIDWAAVLPDGIEKIVLPAGNAIYEAVNWPLERFKVVTDGRYRNARDTVFKIVGVDPDNRADDAGRFALYRQLGYAVVEKDGGEYNVFIPFSAWRGFLESHGYSIDGWEEWHDWHDIPESRQIFMGLAAYKADSAENGGNENGVAEWDTEWRPAMVGMGYEFDGWAHAVDDLWSTYMVHLTPENQEEIKDIMRRELQDLTESQIETPERFNPPDEIPLEKLIEYVRG